MSQLALPLQLADHAVFASFHAAGNETLLATLRTVQTIWRYEHQNRNAEKIAAQAGAIHDQFALVLESMEDVGRQLDRAHESWDKMRQRLSSGRGNLVKRVQDLEKLGARTKRKLPDSIAAGGELPAGEAGDEDSTDNPTE